MATLVLATRNAGKIAEMQRLMSIHAPAIKVVSVAEFNVADVEETGSTFEANALLKAEQICRETKLPALADDSGLCVDALGGNPGILSARWSGVHGNDIANIAKLLDQLSQVTDEKRSAYFVSVIAIATPDGRNMTVRGEIKGNITRAPRGHGGFGYDPVFQPSGYEITFGEMDPALKDEISHRGQALREIAPKISLFLG
jgi:XTP/dITP diphosphohydrolase